MALHLWTRTLAALFAMAAAPLPAHAQAWPSKPVHIVIGFGAGGGTDVATRIVDNAIRRGSRHDPTDTEQP